MRKEKRNKKVVVAMSGGVDSSVAAALLKRDGVDKLRSSPRFANSRVFDVIGVFMKFWAEHKRGELPGFNRCCSLESEIRARKVAKILKIPFYVFNFEKEFKKRVVDCFLKEYKAGPTPNPCVVCNKEIKFGLLLEKALSLDADYIATGHYAKKKKIENRKKKIEYKLLRGEDKKKDQSYFLWKLDQKHLEHILFPVGNYTKEEVRNLAKKFRLPVAETPESQEICFISGNTENFLKKYLKEKPGNIIDKQGKILGRHRGLWFYTIGQRKGIGLSGGPYFVLDKNIKQNVLIVTKNEKDLLKKELVVKNVNWISGKPPKLPMKIKTKIRYRHKAVSARIYNIQNQSTKTQKVFGARPSPKLILGSGTKYKIFFDKPQRAITPGQSAVFYSDQELLGGGIICYNK